MSCQLGQLTVAQSEFAKLLIIIKNYYYDNLFIATGALPTCPQAHSGRLDESFQNLPLKVKLEII